MLVHKFNNSIFGNVKYLGFIVDTPNVVTLL